MAVIPGVEYHPVVRCGDVMGVEDHLAVVVVLDDHTEPVPDLPIGFSSCVERQHFPVLENRTPTPAERFVLLFHRQEFFQSSSRLLVTESGNILEKWNGLPLAGLGLDEKVIQRIVPLQVRNRPPELADELLLDGVAPPSRPVTETLRPDPCAGMVRLRVVEDIRSLGAPGVGDVKIVSDEDVAVEEIGQVTSSLPGTRCMRDRGRCASPYRREQRPHNRNPGDEKVDCRG